MVKDYKTGKKEGNVLFNDTEHILFTVIYCLNTKRQKTSCQQKMGYTFWLAAKDLLYAG